ncbi:Uncharacterized protein FWK35_00013808 [Aphis craccivora]|uniref:Uncharacterized protein n=1 Tax=Aphis craccivora TaxID=307492 RepID=A0A6G0YHM3_APHCR|nr:Uncharacterized protein FWK35_00013808 [Aphis craccivora]
MFPFLVIPNEVMILLGCILFVSVYSITCRNNASISKFEDSIRQKSEYPWCIIEVQNLPVRFKFKCLIVKNSTQNLSFPSNSYRENLKLKILEILIQSSSYSRIFSNFLTATSTKMDHKRVKGGAEKTREIKKIKTTLHMVGGKGRSKKFSRAEKICQSIPVTLVTVV